MARDVSVRVPAALLPVEIFHPGRLFGMPLVPAARAVAVPGDLGFLDAPRPPRELGAPLTLPRSQYDRASWSDPSLLQEFLAFPAEGRGSWDAWGWDLVASEPLPINPLGTGGGKCPSPHQGRVWGVPGGFWALFPASPSCCCNFGAAPCLPCPVAILMGSGLSPLLGRAGWR